MLKEFKNGNLHIKFEEIELGLEPIEMLFLNYDLVPLTDEYSIGNYAMAADWSYNGGSAYYTITSYDLANLNDGKMVILKPLDQTYIDKYLIEWLEGGF